MADQQFQLDIKDAPGSSSQVPQSLPGTLISQGPEKGLFEKVIDMMPKHQREGLFGSINPLTGVREGGVSETFFGGLKKVFSPQRTFEERRNTLLKEGFTGEQASDIAFRVVTGDSLETLPEETKKQLQWDGRIDKGFAALDLTGIGIGKGVGITAGIIGRSPLRSAAGSVWNRFFGSLTRKAKPAEVVDETLDATDAIIFSNNAAKGSDGAKVVTPPKSLSQADSGGRKALDEMTDMFNNAQPTLRKNLDEAPKKASNFYKTLRTEWTDRFTPIKNLVTKVETSVGRKINFGVDPYVAARLYQGANGKIQNILDDLGTSIKKAGNFNTQGQNNLSLFLASQRMAERAARGIKNPRGITQDQAEAAAKLVETPEIKEAAAGIKNITDDLLDRAQKSGIISKAAFNSIKAKNQNYVPFDVIQKMDDDIDNVNRAAGGFSIAEQNVVKSLQGTDKDIADPLEALTRKIIQTTRLIERNEVAKKVANLSKMEGVEDIKKLEDVPQDALSVEARKFSNVTDFINSQKSFYHGTGAKFNKFARDLLGTNTGANSARRGFFMTPSKELAEQYAEVAVGKNLVSAGISDDAMDSFAEIGKIFTDLGTKKDKEIVEKFVKEGWLVKEGKGVYGVVKTDQAVKKTYVKGKIKELDMSRSGRVFGDYTDILDKARKEGFDGVLLKNTFDAPTVRQFDSSGKRISDDVQVVFDENNIIDESGLKDIYTKARQSSRMLDEGNDVFHVYEDGQKVSYQAPKDVIEAMKGMNKEEVDMVTGIVGKTNEVFKGGVTTFNIAFQIPNAIIDFFDAMLIAKNRINVIDWAQGFASAVGKGAKYKQWREDGGAFSTYISQARSARMTVDEVSSGTARKTIKSIMNPLRLLEWAGSVAEETNRLAVYGRALKNGETRQFAAYESRQASVDFARYGNRMRIANQWIPFINARLQGTLNLARVSQERPNRTALRMAFLVAGPQVATYMYNRQFPEYYDIPQWEKDANFIIMTGTWENEAGETRPSYVKIPKGHIGRMVANPVENFMVFQDSGDATEWDKLALQTLSNALPADIARDGELSSTAFLNTVLPPIVKAPIEVQFANKSFFTEQNIVPRSREEASSELQFKENTTDLAKDLGQTELAKTLGLSPAGMDHYVSGLFGTLGRDVVNVIDTARGEGVWLDQDLEKDKKFAKIPVVSRFVGFRGGNNEQDTWDTIDTLRTEATDRRLGEQQVAEEIYETLRVASDEAIPSILKEYEDQGVLNENVERRLKDMYKEKAKKIDALDRQIKALPTDERAKYVLSVINETPDDQLALRLKEFEDKGILTDAVEEDLRRLLQQQ